MFTGIVEHLGSALAITEVERGRRLVIDAGPLAAGAEVGDSVAINGTCLTVSKASGTHLTFEVVGETLDRTNLGDIDVEDPVNLELPMSANGRFDGHIVQGHVDGVGTVRTIEPDGAGRRMTVDIEPSVIRYVVEKGSVTLDGVSLTVTDVDERGLEVALIPHTLAATTLGTRKPGERLNVEVDVLAKYVERLLGARL